MINFQLIIDDIENNIFEDFSLDQLAEKANYSKYHFSREFNTKIGMSISQYIQERRFTYAVQMLSNTEKSITDIAFECGFNSLAYFTKKFKERYSITPKEYIKGDNYINLVERFKLGDIKMLKTRKKIYTQSDIYMKSHSLFNKSEWL